MMKRRFYRHEHGERDDDSDSDFSSSSSDLEGQTSNASEAEAEDHQLPQVKSDAPSISSPSGYDRENSSADEIEADSSGLLVDYKIGAENDGQKITDAPLSGKVDGRIAEMHNENDPLPDDVARCILKCKSVFKCRLCPKIVCLNERTLRAHLKSKRHARSEKLLNDGRLKRVLNSDGEEVVLEEGETRAERHARILALSQVCQSCTRNFEMILPLVLLSLS
ncbi:hypothetical protein Ancab_006358 [Ancistrocladus abbreviatus]